MIGWNLRAFAIFVAELDRSILFAAVRPIEMLGVVNSVCCTRIKTIYFPTRVHQVTSIGKDGVPGPRHPRTPYEPRSRKKRTGSSSLLDLRMDVPDSSPCNCLPGLILHRHLPGGYHLAHLELEFDVLWSMVMKFAASIFLLPLFLATTAQATPEVVLDQEFPGFNWISYYLDYPGDYMAQTFTVQNSGRLQSVGIAVELGGYSNDAPPVDDLHVRLVKTDETGAPIIDSVLASRDYSWWEIPRYPFLYNRYVDFDVSSWNIQVAVGDVLAIALSSDQAAYIPPGKQRLNDKRNYDWWTSAGDRHPGGDFYLYSPILFGPKPHKFIDKWRDPNWSLYPESPRDMGFRVLIAIPEPASILQVFVVGIAFPIVHARIRRR